MHFNGFKRHLDVVRSGNLTGLDKRHSDTNVHLDTPSEDSPDESGDVQDLRPSAPREISLVPMGSTFSDDFDEVPRTTFRSPLRSYTLEVPDEHRGALRQLRSLRSTLSAAIDSYKSNKDLADEPSDGDENEKTRRFNDPGMVWVRGCSCQVSGPACMPLSEIVHDLRGLKAVQNSANLNLNGPAGCEGASHFASALQGQLCYHPG